MGEYDGTGALIEETVWFGDIPVATLRPSSATVAVFYVHSDQLNTPRQVTRPSDNTAMWTWNSDPFGTDAANANPSGAGPFAYNLRFAGQVFDGQAGLHYNYERDYDPAIGRYIESDPIGLTGGINAFGYAEGNSLMRVDPKGLLSLSMGVSWKTVQHVPGKSRTGQERLGLTLATVPLAKCSCSSCGNSWKLTECSAEIQVDVYIRAGMPPGPDANVRSNEQQHVTDYENGVEVIADAGVRAEQNMRSQTFSTQEDCETSSANAVTRALRTGRNRLQNVSARIGDDSGRHNVWMPPSYLK